MQGQEVAFDVSSLSGIAYIPYMNADSEWEPEKGESNFQKHHVSFAEAVTVFFDPLSITVPGPIAFRVGESFHPHWLILSAASFSGSR
jgi:hypothetical protein